MPSEREAPNLPAVRALERFRIMPRFRVLPLVGHAVSLVTTAFVAAYIKNNLGFATVVAALSAGSVLAVLVVCIQRLDHAIGGLGSVLLKIDYMRVHDRRDGAEITEGYLYKRATDEINNARVSIDVFTSYLLEADCKTDADKEARTHYFDRLIQLAMNYPGSITYKRIVQSKVHTDLVRTYTSSHAQAYLQHLQKMQQQEEAGAAIFLKAIDKRRPTTYVIIDDVVLLWQINQINDANEMQMHGMFVVYDPANVFIRHFRQEYNYYWNGEAKQVRLKTVART